jgi:amino acid permease
VPFTDVRLLSGTTNSDFYASPFTIAITDAGIAGLGSLMNTVIVMTAISVSYSSIARVLSR